MKEEGKRKKAEGECRVAIWINQWGGWSIYPANQAARDLCNCTCPSRQRENAPVAIAVDHGGIDVLEPESTVCEDLRGVFDAVSDGDQVSPDADSAVCFECATGNFATHTDAQRAAARNGWLTGEEPEPEAAPDNRDPLLGFAVLFCGVLAFWGGIIWLVGRAFFGGGR